ncbi:hypothetical protein R1flu_012309 [Riccia fluitans]|uniref:Uncharacterized protein n=1 Tax=Riccia fluitans TaxID=41844 RepID=A0ABD1ZDK5_9MARC
MRMDDKAVDVVGSSEDFQPPQEIPDIVEANVDAIVGTASSWARLDALDSIPRMYLTPGWNTHPGASIDHCLLADEVTLAKPQSDEGEGGCSLSLPSN